jgi:hypothetical protein
MKGRNKLFVEFNFACYETFNTVLWVVQFTYLQEHKCFYRFFYIEALDLTCVINTHTKGLWCLAQDIKCVVIELHD